jgi:hypothetical protein
MSRETPQRGCTFGINDPKVRSPERRGCGPVDCIVVGRRHLEAVLAEYVEHYNAHRPHRYLRQRAPSALDTAPALVGDVDLARLRRTDHLGGLIDEYRMVA